MKFQTAQSHSDSLQLVVRPFSNMLQLTLERERKEVLSGRVFSTDLRRFIEKQTPSLLYQLFCIYHLSHKIILEVNREEDFLVPKEFFMQVTGRPMESPLWEARTDLAPY